MRMQIMQAELIDERLLDFFMENEEAVGVDGTAAKLEELWHVAVDVNGLAVEAVAGEIGNIVLAVEIFHAPADRIERAVHHQARNIPLRQSEFLVWSGRMAIVERHDDCPLKRRRYRQYLDDINQPHDRQHDGGYAKERAAQAHFIAGHMDEGLQIAEQHEYPGQHHEHDSGTVRDIFENGQHIEQHGQFELIAKGVGNLQRVRRPVRLAQREIIRPRHARTYVLAAQRREPEEQREGEDHFEEQREQDRLRGHWLIPGCRIANA